MKPSVRTSVSSLSKQALSSTTRKYVSNTPNARSSLASTDTTPSTSSLLQYPVPKSTTSSKLTTKEQVSPLAKLPLSSILRSLLVLSISSSPVLLRPCISTLSALAHPRSPITDVSRNPVLSWLIRNTLYKQFNAGENKAQVQQSIHDIKQLGYRGVLLGYAREVLVNGGETETTAFEEKVAREEVETWLRGTLQTVDMATEGDFVALKLTGMGSYALQLLKQRKAPSPMIDEAIKRVCDAAIARNARLLVDAEEQAVQPGIEDWVMQYQKYCSRQTPERATLYCTYQAYLKSTPATIARHLEISRSEGYTLGVKLVRGAYLKTEPRHLIWDTKEETDQCYDGVVEALLTRKYNSMLQPAAESATDIPPVNLIIATHNRDSVQKAHRLRLEQAAKGEPRIELAYAQLQGMADEVSCELVDGFRDSELGGHAASPLETPNVYKLLTWGSIKECMGFLLRRAIENTEAVGRTKESQQAMAAELIRRFKNAFQ